MEIGREISAFLTENGIIHDTETADGHSVVVAYTRRGRQVIIIPVPMVAESPEEAVRQSEKLSGCIEKLAGETGERPFIIPEDRWRRQSRMIRPRLLAHMETFTQVYARNCEVRKIDKKTAAGFLEMNHSYGDASCRYRYGLYLKRHTGHNASDKRHVGELVAVATFSNARKWIKGEKTIRSYEWTRYASLPGMRISGGMGKLLKAFIEDVKPDDIMTYADLEWSEGKVYEALGFVLEGQREAVTFRIPDDSAGDRFYTNLGSNKYRLKLTDYQ